MPRVDVLLATDGSESAKKAEIAALKITNSYNVRIAALFVVNIPSMSDRKEMIQFGEKILEDVEKEGKKMGVKVQKILKLGSPAETILDVANNMNVHTIVVGAEGKKGLKRVLLGSVAGKVVQNAQCSVLVAR
jgi:nucleotide-binding universal stress UspA family protein